MKKVFLKYFVFYIVVLCLVNALNIKSSDLFGICKIILESILGGAVLSGITVLLKINFLRNNKEKLREHKKKERGNK